MCWVFRDPEEGSEQDRDCQADTAAVIQRGRMSHMKFAKRMDRFGEGIFSKLAEIKKEKTARGEEIIDLSISFPENAPPP